MAEVDMSVIKPNSNASKRVEKTKMTPIIPKDEIVNTKKEPKKILGFIDPEDFKDLAEYALFDVIIPEIKTTFLESIAIAIGMEGFNSRRYSERTSYSSYYNKKERTRNRDKRRYDRKDEDHDDNIDYREIKVKNRRSAEKIVDMLHQQIEDTGEATIGDLYNLVDIPCKYTDENWGWKRKSDIGIRYIGRDGYLIDVADAKYLY